MNNPQGGGDIYYNNASARSPPIRGAQPQNVQRASSSQFDSYGDSSSTADMFPPHNQGPRYDPHRFDRTNGPMQPAYGALDMQQQVHTWNLNAFNANSQVPSPGYAFAGRGGHRGHPLRARPVLPQGWLPPDQMAQMGGYGANGSMHMPHHRGSDAHDMEDELIPTAIVIKNIPFAVRKEQLLELMSRLVLPLPYAFNYHFDAGVFRGLAFANFTSADETEMVIGQLNHYEIQGRRLRVEYKKMLPAQERDRIEREKRERRGQLEEQHRPIPGNSLQTQPSMSSMASRPANTPSPSVGSQMTLSDQPNLNDPKTLSFYNELFRFKDSTREAMIYPPHLSAAERRIVHTIAQSMSLYHHSHGTGDQRQVHVTRHERGSPPFGNISQIQPSDRTRQLNKAATIDFNEARGTDQGNFNLLRGQQSTGFLGIPDSPSALTANQNLRGAKSVADLRSITPSPSTASPAFQQNMPSNYTTRYQNYHGSVRVPTIATGPFSHADDETIVNGFGGMRLTNGESPRRARPTFSWENEHQASTNGPNSAGAIGSNRAVSVNNSYENASRDRVMPVRQPHGPPSERVPSTFARGRQPSHQQRGSDELRQHKNDVIRE